MKCLLEGEMNDEKLAILANYSKDLKCKYLNLSNSDVTYDGIVLLWRSKTFGSVSDDEPIYERYYNLQVSVVKIEIKNTPALKQYNELLIKGKKIFPLPLRKNFDIIYFNSDEKQIGFKDIILLNCGKVIG